MAVVGIMEFVLVALMGLPIHQVIGLPPGDRDPNLVHMASNGSLVYLEWAARAEGKAGAPGIDGMAADPEIQMFLTRIKETIQKSLVEESRIDDLKILPELAVKLSKHPGCVFVELNLPADAGPPAGPEMVMQALQAGLIFNAGDEADEIAAELAKLASLAFRQEIEGLDHLPLPAPIPMELHQYESYLIFGVGQGAVDNMIQRLSNKKGGIADHEAFAGAMEDMVMDRTGSILFVDAVEVIHRVKVLFGVPPFMESALEFTGLDDLEWMANVNGLNEQGQLFSRTKFKGLKTDNGLLAAIANSSITAKELSIVPGDSDLVVATNFDLETLKNAIIELAPAEAQEQMEQGFAQTGMMIGLDWDEDVFGVFDNTFVLSNSPGDGGWILSTPVLSVAVKDKEQAKIALAKVSASLHQILPKVQDGGWRRRGITLEKQTFMGSQIFMINTVGDDVPMAPCWCLTDTHLMLGLHPQTLKSRLRRMADESWSSMDVVLNGVPEGDVVMVTHASTESLVRQLYGIAPWFGQVIFGELQSEGIPMTLMDFPSAAAVLPYMSDTRSFVIRTADGIEVINEGPPVVSTLPVMVPVIPFMFFATVQRADAARFEAIGAEIAVEKAIEVIEADVEIIEDGAEDIQLQEVEIDNR